MTPTPQLPLGLSLETQRLSYQSLASLQTHSVTQGKSGSGKSVFTALRLAIATSSLGLSVVVIDPKDDIGPLLTRMLSARGLADDIRQVAPFQSAPVALNPLAPQEGLEVGVQAAIAARHIESLFGGEALGARMRRLFLNGAQALISCRGSLLDFARMLESDEYAARVAEHLEEPRLRRFWLEGYREEPTTARLALLARLDSLLSVRSVRSSLCARGAVSGRDLLGGITIVNTGAPPAGSEGLSRFFAGLLLELVLIPAVFARPVGSQKHVALVVDEVPEVLRAAAAEQLERVSSLARALNVSLHLLLQDERQLDRASPLLSSVIRTNARHRYLFEPTAAQVLKELGEETPAPDYVDPKDPSRLLNSGDAQRRWARWVERLGPRHFLHLSRGRHQVLRSPNAPLEEIERRWQRLETSRRERLIRGTLSRGFESLDGEAQLRFKVPTRKTTKATSPRRATKRPKLVLPK